MKLIALGLILLVPSASACQSLGQIGYAIIDSESWEIDFWDTQSAPYMENCKELGGPADLDDAAVWLDWDGADSWVVLVAPGSPALNITTPGPAFDVSTQGSEVYLSTQGVADGHAQLWKLHGNDWFTAANQPPPGWDGSLDGQFAYTIRQVGTDISFWSFNLTANQYQVYPTLLEQSNLEGMFLGFRGGLFISESSTHFHTFDGATESEFPHNGPALRVTVDRDTIYWMSLMNGFQLLAYDAGASQVIVEGEPAGLFADMMAAHDGKFLVASWNKEALLDAWNATAGSDYAPYPDHLEPQETPVEEQTPAPSILPLILGVLLLLRARARR